MNALISRFLKDKSGATAIEYGLIAGLIAVVIITSVTLIGDNLGEDGVFGTIAEQLGNVDTSGDGGS
jgi:pilus assembly protein Flp/PilA